MINPGLCDFYGFKISRVGFETAIGFQTESHCWIPADNPDYVESICQHLGKLANHAMA
jgi:hypothetical protein